nr:protein kinase-like domain-containing protein [Tanacetum cinerariifolium]
MDGSIPHSVFNLSLLHNLTLADNHLTGSLPSEIGNQLPNLEFLQLTDNELTGVLPPSISNCSKLVLLEMGDNNFGSLPLSIGSLVGLTTLGLEFNQLEGKIPTTIGKLKKLQVLSLSANHLSGSIPSDIKDLKMLRELDLSYNNLSGSITSSLGKIPGFLDRWNSLEFLHLSFNDFEGEVPVRELQQPKEEFVVPVVQQVQHKYDAQGGYCWHYEEEIEFCDDSVDGFEEDECCREMLTAA